MPYKFDTDHIKLKPDQDRRRKLDDLDKDKIRRLYKAGEYSQRELATLFGVSRRLIVFTVFPERLEAYYKKRKEEKAHLKYYNKDNHRKDMKRYRRYKQTVLTGKGVK